MTKTEFSTLLKLITELNDKIDTLGKDLRKEIKAGFKKHRKECHEEHMEILKALEAPYLEHDRRITKLEKVVST